MKIKICGLKYSSNLKEVLDLKPDFSGFIFYPKSPRYFDQISPEELKQINFRKTKKVGVFVNESPLKILETVKKYNLDYVQLHGSETLETCDEIRQKGIGIIKAFPVAKKNDLSHISSYEGYIDFILLDTKTQLYGGSGIKFDWNLLTETKFKKPTILGGGISYEDTNEIENIQSLIYGVDINSRFEIEPGLKNINVLKKFIHKIRAI